MTISDSKPQDTKNDPRWRRIVVRDKMADGQFWYSVTTTGIYCRPSCPSRTPKPSNVTVHDTLDSARNSGCRPCKRCNPEGCSKDIADAALIERACRFIETSDTLPSLNKLAEAVWLSPSYFHNLFKNQTGLTPKSYASGYRSRKVHEGLSQGAKVTDVVYDAGFNSNGRFYAQSSAMLGMTPKRYRDGGPHEVLHFTVAECSLGSVLIASSEKGVACILLGNDPDALVRDLQDRFPKAELIGADVDYEQSIAKVIGFIEDPDLGLNLPLDVRGTAFQQRVWQALRQIPAGETATYAEVAQRIGHPTAARAVAGACAANHIAVAIPCHRVIRNDGSLSGYRWGVERKRALLSREGGKK